MKKPMFSFDFEDFGSQSLVGQPLSRLLISFLILFLLLSFSYFSATDEFHVAFCLYLICAAI